jgi:hypothetical protein
MSEFVFLYRRSHPPLTPQEKQDALARWQAWFKAMEAQGHLAQYGQPLDLRAGRVVRGDKGGTVSDGPYAETKDIVAGFSLITARDLDEAEALAKACPIFDEGGMIEIRPILKMP